MNQFKGTLAFLDSTTCAVSLHPVSEFESKLGDTKGVQIIKDNSKTLEIRVYFPSNKAPRWAIDRPKYKEDIANHGIPFIDE